MKPAAPLAADWGDWASACEGRTAQPCVGREPVVELEFRAEGRTLSRQRIDAATGEVLLAEVVPFGRRR